MLLQRLVERHRQNAGAIEMYQSTRVAWKICLDRNGKLQGFVPLTGDGKKGDRGQEMMAPTIVRAVAIKPKLLCDNGEYVLGVARGEDPKGKVAQRHASFREIVRTCAQATAHPGVAAVDSFLASWDPIARPLLPADFDPSAVLTFEVEGAMPIEDASVQRFWAVATRDASEAGTAPCLVCGEVKSIEQRHPKKIKGVPGAQSSGAALISANEDAFESFGLSKSETSPTCRECAEGFADALNNLLASPETRITLGPSVYLFWNRGPAGASEVLRLIDKPEPKDVQALLDSPRRGRDVSHLISLPDFFLVSLSASGGRVVIRDYLEASLEDARANVARWFRLQRMVGVEDPIGLYALAKGTVFDDLDELSPSLLSSLVRSALNGDSVSEGFLPLLARRNRVEGGPSRPRAVLTRMILISNPKYAYAEDALMTVEANNTEPAYLCGRLFAELAAAQRAALGDTGTTIVDRFFGTASSAPATVFGPLLRGGQAHLAKLRQTKPGAHVAIESRIQQITSKIPTFPLTLDLRQQALFSLGYYHQKEANHAQAKSRAAAKNEEVPIEG